MVISIIRNIPRSISSRTGHHLQLFFFILITSVDSAIVKGAGGVKIEYIFISLHDEGHRDLHNAFYRIKTY